VVAGEQIETWKTKRFSGCEISQLVTIQFNHIHPIEQEPPAGGTVKTAKGIHHRALAEPLAP
jgi:hypothetical protein